MKTKQVFLLQSENLSQGERLCFVKGPDGKMWFDVAEKAPTELQVFLPCEGTVLNEISAHLSPFGVVDEALEAHVFTALKKRVMETLALAKKSGFAVASFEKAKEIHQKGGLKAVFLASDAGADAVKRVKSWHKEICTALTKEELSHIFSAENVSVVALKGNDEIKNVMLALKRLKRSQNE